MHNNGNITFRLRGFRCKKANQKIYDKIMRYAGNLVRVGQDIEKEFGVPIINKRISVTPIALVAGASGENPTLNIAARSTNAQRNSA